MKVVISATFQSGYTKLATPDQRRADKAIRLLGEKKSGAPWHPSLRAKRIRGTTDIWEASVTMRIRLTFQIYDETLYLRVIGDHDKALGHP